MKKVVFIGVFAGLMSSVWFSGCKKETIDPGAVPEQVSFKVPEGWPQPAYSFANNPLTTDGFNLGKKLFYDMRLSRDTTVSCGSCHQQFASFAQLGHDVSHGINGLLGTRNSPGLANIAWSTSFFWDGGVNNLENQPINPIQSHVEMDMTMPEVIARLGADAGYLTSFRKAFGDETVNSQRIFKAMAQFMAAMVSADSKYDKYVRNEPGGTFTPSEVHGLQLFRQHCAGCHKEPLFSDFSFRNNGMKPNSFNDSGRAKITLEAADLYKFKVPSLRNVALTKPYMHDGTIATLDAALEHYRTGVYAYATVDPLLTGGLNMGNADKNDIISFLETLTDTTFVKNKLFAEPAP